MDIQITYRRLEQTIELHYQEPTRRRWQSVAERARSYLKKPEVVDATDALDRNLASEWAMGQAALDHLAYAFVPPIKITAMEAHMAFNLLAASNLYLNRKGKEWKAARDVLFTMAEIAPVALDPLTLPPAEQLGMLDLSRRESYEQLRADLAAAPAWITGAIAEWRCLDQSVLPNHLAYLDVCARCSHFHPNPRRQAGRGERRLAY